MVNSERRARVAVVGCGSFSSRSILPNFAFIPSADLVAVCDIVAERAMDAARRFGARRYYSDMEKMLDSEELDGVFIIGPAPMHYELAPKALRRGIPVYVEKPSAVTAQQAMELAELADAHSTFGQVGFMKRFADVYRMAKEIVSRDEFGQLHIIRCKFAQGPYPSIWGIEPPCKAMLIGQLCHIFDLVRYFGGDVRCVHALYREVTPTQFAFLVNLQFASGALSQLYLSSLDCKQGFRDICEVLELIGYETHIVCEDMLRLYWQRRSDFTDAAPHAGRYLCVFSPTWTGIIDSRRTFGYLSEVEHFIKRCLNEASGGPDLWDGYWSLRIAEAVYESAMSGGVVELIG
ncbi:MAG: Gfo/Idh/MocA family oxidoreductase [Armatimonadota bacterium]|nr:Gfo/Idh/MocA family oxidoreductase [Armatimonadota bacterium]MCX7776466.1 Gfo/Idh/MocA family oxidoreductase [Armatimonadota bacterium]MDW8024264.1 Gfo/Idh/MocA family oxidoreductase [Armatimonadota bacterium]